jgi:hypothetical protein
VLKFTSSKFDSLVPEYKGDLHKQDADFFVVLTNKLQEYIQLLEEVKIKKAL